MSNATIPTAEELRTITSYVDLAVRTNMCKENERDLYLSKILFGREMGIPPMTAMSSAFNVVFGKIELSAHTRGDKIRRAGHSYTVSYSADEKTCTIVGKRKDTGDTISTSFSMRDAEKAELLKGQGWTKYPKDMLYARCLTRLCNQLFPDVFGGATYAPGEISNEPEVELEEVSAVEQKEEPQKEGPEGPGEDMMQVMVDELFSMFPADEESFARYVIEKAEKANMSIENMYIAMYKAKEYLPKKYLAWKDAEYLEKSQKVYDKVYDTVAAQEAQNEQKSA